MLDQHRGASSHHLPACCARAGYRATASPLKRAITRPMLLFLIIGDILGGGIYALTGEVGGEIGGAIWVAFAVAGVVAAFTAASYAELVSKYPQAAGAALYVHKAFRVPLVLLLLFAFVAVHVSVLRPRSRPVEHEHFRAWTGFPILGALSCAALIVQKLVEDTVVFAYAGGLIAVGLLLWLVARVFTGPSTGLDPAELSRD